MSGTSMDGIDAVLVDLSQAQPQLLEANTYAWPSELKQRLNSVAQGQAITPSQLAELDAEVGEHFAGAALSISSKAEGNEIKAIGSHGQTIAHNPSAKHPYTLQIGDPSRISEKCKITTVADFRRRDISAGGEGAPLLPAYHQTLFRNPEENRLVLNIGGISNLTWLAADTSESVTGFDTGPGNCLMDEWIKKHHDKPYDLDGAWAAEGKPNAALLRELLSDSYYQQSAPKSTGTDYFCLDRINKVLEEHTVSAVDTQATLLQLTARSIADAIKKQYPQADKLLVCGGGAHNPTLLGAISDATNLAVVSTEKYGLAPDWVEAVGFAWLAQQTMNKKAGNLPEVTGAKGPRILGAIYPA